MIRFLHLADLHLGWSPSFLQGDRRTVRQGERDSLLQRAADLALQERVDFVLIVGDLFETHIPDGGIARRAAEQLARLEGGGIRVITVPGNHDEISYHNGIYRREIDSWPGHLVTNPAPEHCLSFEAAGTSVHLYSMAYTGGVTDVNALSDLPRCSCEGVHIGAFHGSLDWDAGERSLPLSSRALEAADYHYTALGHIHQHQVRPVGAGLACYPGMVEHKSLSEPGVGHFTVVSVRDGKATLETPPTSVRDHRRETLDVSSLAGQEDLVARCLELADPEAVIEMELTGAAPFPISLEQMLEALDDQFFHLQVADRASFIDEVSISRYERERTVRGQFVRDMKAEIDRAECEGKKKILGMALSLGLCAFMREGSP